MKQEHELSTYYIPQGETRTLRFPQYRHGQEEGRTIWIDDRGTLLAVVEIEEADSDKHLLLNQYNAQRLIRDLLLLVSSGHDPSDWVRVTRYDDGGWKVETEEVNDASGAM